MSRKYFGTDGIRGRANGLITPELALKVGQAAGLVFQRGDHRHRVVIGKDTRLSGYMIEYAMVAGFTSVGMDVLLLGPMPTPAVAMLTKSMRADLGVMISASHNLFEDNGIKLFGPQGFKLSDDVEMQIEQLLDESLDRRLAQSASLGRARRIDGVHDRYIEFAKRTLPRDLSLDGLRVVIDCANGAAYKVVPEALWELGADVISIGVEPDGFNINKECGSTSPEALSRKVREMRADLGVMISASHNLFEDNGIKLFGPQGFKLSDDVEKQIEQLLDESLDKRLAQSASLGRARRIDGVHDRYIEFAKRTLPRDLSLDGLRVVVDCANGAAYKVVPEALWELGADVIAMGVEPDGFNINKECGSTSPEALSRKVREMRADIGIALDGDADRVILVDERGHVVDGDQLLAVIAQSWKEDGRLAKPGIVATVMSNLGLERFLEGQGIELVRTPVGDRYVLEQMLSRGYNLGGEPSGHIILSDYATTGDGFVAALQVLAVVQKLRRPVSEVCHRFDPLPQILKNVRYRSGKPLDDADVKSAIVDGEKRLNGHGRLLVRSSGTEPVIRVMGEGDDRILVEEVVDHIVSALGHAAAA